MGKKTTGKKGHGRETCINDESNSLEEVINNKIRHNVGDVDLEFGATQSEVVTDSGGDVNKKKKENKREEIRSDDADIRASENGVEMKDDVNEDEKKTSEAGGNDDGLSTSHIETVVEGNVGEDKRKKKEKRSKKRHEVSGIDFEAGDGRNEDEKKRIEVGSSDGGLSASCIERVVESNVGEDKRKKKQKRSEKRHEVSGIDFEAGDGRNEDEKKRIEVGGSDGGLSASCIERVVESNVGEDKRKKKQKRSEKRHEVSVIDFEFGGGRNEDEKKRIEVGSNDDGLSTSRIERVVENNVGEGKKREKRSKKKHEVSGIDFEFGDGRNEVGGNDDGLSASRIERVVESNVGEDKRKKKEKRSKKRHEVSGIDFEFGDGRNEADIEADVEMNNTGNENVRKKRKKRKLEINEDENETQKSMKDKRRNDDGEASEINSNSKQNHLGLEESVSPQKNYQEDSGNNSELELRKKCKKRNKEDINNDGNGIVLSLNDIAEDTLTGEVVKGQMNPVEQGISETVNRKESYQKKKSKQYKGDNRAGDGTIICNGTNGEAGRERELFDKNIMEKVENGRKEKKKKKTDHNVDVQVEKLWNVDSGVKDMEGHAVLDEGKKDKKKKAESLKKRSGGDKKASRTEKGVEPYDPSEASAKNQRSKKVSFSDDVQVFPSSNVKNGKDGFVRGKRFSKEEDEMIKKAVVNYIEAHRLGEEGLNMVLNCRSHPEVKHCWKEIGAALPWRPSVSIYYRAHIIYQRDKNRKWTPEELELVQKFHEKHGSNWKMLADALGKHRFHVKDAWRRIKLPNRKKGQWSQEEYRKLFDLVNMDLRMRASEEKKTKHGMLRDNIGWEAISDKLATRSFAICCMKWYNQITSPMVAEGKWADTDDFHLVSALTSLDACCMDDVDWDNILEHRSGTRCRKRWNQMVKHLGTDGNKSFSEQVEILSERYSPDVLEAREAYNSKPAVD